MSARPNLVYILADDMGYGDVSCLNANSRIRTQRLDRIVPASEDEGISSRDAAIAP
jgi:arylsulfatase A-like enzyme